MSVAVASRRVVVPRSVALGVRIQGRRRAIGYRFAKDFAQALGWTAATVSRLEAGQRDIFERDVEPLCRALQVLPAWLSGDEDAAQAPLGALRAPLGRPAMLALIEDLIERRREEIAALERTADLLRGEAD